VLLVLVVMAGAGVGAYAGLHEFQLHRSTRPAAASPPSALAHATDAPTPAPTSAPAPTPDPAAVARALAAAIAAPALGAHVLAQVGDADTGTQLFSRLATTTAAPASTAKLLVAAAILATRGPTYRITTQVHAGGSPGTVVLVGGGDPTLTSAVGTNQGAYTDAARVADLGAQLRAAHVVVSRVVVDDSAFTGPATSPAWAPEDVPSDYAAPITATMVDGGRATPIDVIRSSAPEIAAGHALAVAAGSPGAAVGPGPAPPGSAVLATVRSAPVAILVAQMLQQSDNVIAECLARQVALATSGPASFSGAAHAVRTVLTGMGVDPGAGMVDGSGLAASDRISVATLVGVLRLVVQGTRPALRDIVTALPVAGWSGTLANRYRTATTGEVAAGVVRAKTGTLTGVSSLAGLVRDADGRLLVFAFIADRVPTATIATAAAETALDRIAAVLAACGCR
jgi:D-alanyl-D-alanine carboxypeptidase/D-alanyl-D-alanine-endopeptidase (penicillin-binding protein 4)